MLGSVFSFRLSLASSFAFLGLAMLAGCDGVGDDFEGTVSEITVEVLGSGAAARVGDTVRVQAAVTDNFDTPATDVTVRWSVSEGAGEVLATTDVTGDSGRAFVDWVLGPTPGSTANNTGQAITAQVESRGDLVATTAISVTTGPVGGIEIQAERDTLDVNTSVALRVVQVTDVFGNEVDPDRYDDYGIDFFSLDPEVAEVGPPPPGTGGEPGLVVGIAGREPGSARIVATAGGVAKPLRNGSLVRRDLRLPSGTAADTVEVAVVEPAAAGLFPVETITAGVKFTCGLDPKGDVFCWGANAAGQLGTGDLVPRVFPTRVVGLPGPAQGVSAGGAHACALLESGRVFCWGERFLGRLGNGGPPTQTGPQPTPVEALLPDGADGVTAVRAGGSASCALLSDGGALCWGFDGRGVLGDGAPPDPSDDPDNNLLSTVPVQVSVPEGVRLESLSNISEHVCATADDGAAYCWGDATEFKLGIGFTLDRNRPEPARVLPTAIEFEATATHSIASSAISSDGRLYGWGAASGIDPSASGLPGVAFEATPVNAAEVFTSVSGGAGFHGCALTSGGKVSCWGQNDDGQLGTGDTTDTVTPVPVVFPDPDLRLAELDVGAFHTCAVAGGSDTAYCWGLNQFGELGNGEQTLNPTPVPVRVETAPDGDARPLGRRADPAVHRREWCASIPSSLRRTVGVCGARLR